MLDILGAMILAALAVVFIGVLAFAGTDDGRKRRGLALLGGAWFVAIAGLGAAGIFSRAPLGTPAIGAAVLLPLLVGLVVFRSTAGAFARAVPLPTLIAIHAGRLFGAFFLLLYSAGRLPATFALTAGWGDILVGAAAVPLALAVHRRAGAWRPLTVLWSLIGTLDLLTAVTLGVGSAPNSPVRFIFEGPGGTAMASLPWLLVPGFFVPLYLLTHAAVFARLASVAREGRPSMAAPIARRLPGRT